jgi:hypothetical protein
MASKPLNVSEDLEGKNCAYAEGLSRPSRLGLQAQPRGANYKEMLSRESWAALPYSCDTLAFAAV